MRSNISVQEDTLIIAQGIILVKGVFTLTYVAPKCVVISFGNSLKGDFKVSFQLVLKVGLSAHSIR